MINITKYKVLETLIFTYTGLQQRSNTKLYNSINQTVYTHQVLKPKYLTLIYINLCTQYHQTVCDLTMIHILNKNPNAYLGIKLVYVHATVLKIL